jgi:hypothetical protein
MVEVSSLVHLGGKVLRLAAHYLTLARIMRILAAVQVAIEFALVHCGFRGDFCLTFSLLAVPALATA